MTSILNNFWVPACFVPSSRYRLQCQNLCRSSRGRDLVLALMNSVKVNVCTCKKEERVGSLFDKGQFGAICGEKMREEDDKLDPLWDDGCGIWSVKDLLGLAQEIMEPDAGPPRWFCPVSSGRPLKDSPILLYLPGLDGLGVGLSCTRRLLGMVAELLKFDACIFRLRSNIVWSKYHFQNTQERVVLGQGNMSINILSI